MNEAIVTYILVHAINCIKTMAAEEVLFNATIVLIPIWLGVARYMIKETEFQSTSTANAIGLGMVFVLFGILFPMWVSIQQLVTQSEQLATGLFVLFVTVGLTGLGAVLFIIREIEHISGLVVTGVPIGIIVIGIGVFFLPSIIEQLPDASIDLFLTILTSLAGAISAINGLYSLLSEEFRERLKD